MPITHADLEKLLLALRADRDTFFIQIHKSKLEGDTKREEFNWGRVHGITRAEYLIEQLYPDND